MNIIAHQYGVTPYAFLDIFNHVAIPPGTWLTTATIHSLVSTSCTESLEQTKYNYAIQSSHDSTRPFAALFIGDAGGGGVRTSSPRLMLINNVEDAATIFKVARYCQDNINYYRHLFGQPHLQPYDEVAISIASHVLGLSSGFHDFPRYSIEVPHNHIHGHLSIGNHTICNLTGVNYVGIQ